MALIQEPWYREGCIMGLNIPGYTLYPLGGKNRRRARILVRNMNLWVLLDLFYGVLVVVLVKYFDGTERKMVVCSAYLPYDSEDPPQSKDLVRYCEKEH
jgi:hypothetical protein